MILGYKKGGSFSFKASLRKDQNHPSSFHSLYTHTRFLAINSGERKAFKQGEEGFPEQEVGKIEVFDLSKGVITSFISFLLTLPIFVMDLSWSRSLSRGLGQCMNLFNSILFGYLFLL